MTYQETLDWMFAQLPMYQQKGKVAFNAKLDKSISFSNYLGNPEKKFKSIHVAGTNGKGSCSHMLASVLQQAGYKTGLYTSPHLKDFRERIKLNGVLASKDFVVDFIARHKEYLEFNQLSFFEMTVGMALEFFAQKKVDIAVVEVGLGGRLDSTNVITPEICLITNIGFDHTDILGDSLEKIAVEKAGIIKKNVPLVVSEYQKEVSQTFESMATDLNSKIVFAEKEIHHDYETSLLGTYQSKNVRGVIAVIKELKEFVISEEHIEKGLRNVVVNTGLMGRWQVLAKNPAIICDTAHNKEALFLVLDQLKGQQYSQLHIVLGFVRGKRLEDLLPLFPKAATYYFAKPDNDRGVAVHDLKKTAENYGLQGEGYASVQKALDSAQNNATETDIIFVGGSTFVVAEVV